MCVRLYIEWSGPTQSEHVRVRNRSTAQIRNPSTNRTAADQPDNQRRCQGRRSYPNAGLNVVRLRNTNHIIAFLQINRLKFSVAVTFEIGDQFGNTWFPD